MIKHDHYIALKTIVRKESNRIIRIWSQTLLPPLITQTLYFVIFGKFIGSQVRAINGVSYMEFIVPGLVMMAVIGNAYGNVVASFYGAKFQRSIEEMLVSLGVSPYPSSPTSLPLSKNALVNLITEQISPGVKI